MVNEREREPPTPAAAGERPWPLRAGIGLLLVIVFWILNWSLSGLRTHWGFFPLWLGYCLVVDAWAWKRSGASIWSRSRGSFAVLFLMSAPMWWLFELINWRTRNWEYLGREAFTDLEYFVLASVSFSTVLPAVFGTARLMSTFAWVQRLQGMGGFTLSAARCRMLSLIGAAMLGLLLVWPRFFFPLAWVSIFLIVDPLNDARGRPSLVRMLARGDARPWAALASGCLVCGFFWEMWNFYSYPKWLYNVPFVDFARIFEMPLLGYGGYLPFALELFALYQWASGGRGVHLVEPASLATR